MVDPSGSFHFLLRILPARLSSRLARSQELQRALNNINWLLLQTVFEGVLGLVVGVWVARYLQPGRYGTLNYAIAFVQMMTPLAALGLGSTVVRDLIHRPEAAPTIMGTTAFLRALGSVALVVASVTAIHFVRPGDAAILTFVIIVAVGHGVRNLGVVELWFQANLHAKYVTVSRGASRVLGAGLKVGLIAAGAGLPLFVAAYGLEVGLPVLGMLLFYRFASRQPLGNWRVDRVVAKQVFADSWPLVFSGLMSVVYMRIDQVMLGQVRGDQEVGVYSAAVRLSEAFYLLPNIVIISVFPWLVKGRSISTEIYQERFQRLYDVFVWGSIAAGLFMHFAAGLVVSLLFGEAYAAAKPVLMVHVWGGLFWFSGSVGHRYLIAENHTRITLLMTTCGAVTNVLLNLWLIPLLGALGAAYATLASFAISHWLAAAFFAKSRPMLWFFLRTFDPAGLARRWRSARP